MKILIFTDLDGTLLNHEDYSYADALPSLTKIRQAAIPLILTTSKTHHEIEMLQIEMGIDDPFIVENGAAVCFPPNYTNFLFKDVNGEPPFQISQTIQLGISYGRIRTFIEAIRNQFNIRGFGDMTVHEISDMTGLTLKKAEYAKQRQYTEPFIMANEENIYTLREAAIKRGIKITKGGRFYHMIGMNQDKGEAVKIVRNIFDRKLGEEHLTIGLGDSINDLPMLQNVDIPVLIPNPEKGIMEAGIPGLIRAAETGANGWNNVIWRLLDELKASHS
jgi:mannosyl-3-phosphoglycerate phosphatase